ncbi:hypothetical protein HGRIS_003567 [Hohenbuehelia grisea]|uniref:Uncharacterized protein n=1 Tax=Hohenbuehelia grisea TaxID=104357 RepID=A0ABR3JGF3_9AGAR
MVTVIWLRAPGSLMEFALPYGLCLPAIVTTRMLLNLREVIHPVDETEVSGPIEFGDPPKSTSYEELDTTTAPPSGSNDHWREWGRA